MTTQLIENSGSNHTVRRMIWLRVGIKAALFSIVSVVLVQALLLTIWPEIALFLPLSSYLKSGLFTLVPVLGASGVFDWITRHQARPVKKFIVLSIGLLLLSFIPDYSLPVEHKTLLASSAAALLHIVAAGMIVTTIVTSYRSLKFL